jgi:hypothetical protein
MTRVIIIVREAGKLKPDYSLDFDLPEVPQVGAYVSMHRPEARTVRRGSDCEAGLVAAPSS